MQNFHHHPDGLIYVRTDAGIYCDSVENFALDLGQPYPGLPEGFDERYYEPGVKHCLSTRTSAVPQELSWPEGDAYIAAYDSLVAAKNLRLGI